MTNNKPDLVVLATAVADRARLLAEAKEQHREASSAETRARNVESNCASDLAEARKMLDEALNKLAPR